MAHIRSFLHLFRLIVKMLIKNLPVESLSLRFNWLQVLGFKNHFNRRLSADIFGKVLFYRGLSQNKTSDDRKLTKKLKFGDRYPLVNAFFSDSADRRIMLWLAEPAYVYHGICQKLEGEMPGLNSLKAKQQAFELVFSGKCPYLQSGEVYVRLCQAAFFCRV